MASAILRIQQTFLPTIFGRNDVIKKRTLQVVLHRTSTSSFSDFRNPSLRLTYRSTILRLKYRSKEEKFVTWRDFTNLLFSSVYSFEETASDRHSVRREDRYAGAGKARMGSYKGVKSLGSFLFILFEFVFAIFQQVLTNGKLPRALWFACNELNNPAGVDIALDTIYDNPDSITVMFDVLSAV